MHFSAPDFTQPYTGPDALGPRLVVLYDGDDLVAPDVLRWNTAKLASAVASLPTGMGMFLAMVDQSFTRLCGLDAAAWTTHTAILDLTVHGAYDNRTGEVERKTFGTHRPVGTRVHILSADYLLGLSVGCYNPKRSLLTTVKQLAFNVALESIAALSLRDKAEPHEQQFREGVIAPYWDIVCLEQERQPDGTERYFHQAYRTNYQPNHHLV